MPSSLAESAPVEAKLKARTRAADHLLGADVVVSQPPSENESVRRVLLPSGREIEVVHFASVSPLATPPAPLELERCGACHGALVQPVDWQEAGPEHWELELHCPNCDWRHVGVFSQQAVERYEEALDRGTDELVGDLRHLQQANMEEDVERFALALAADHVLPEDF